MRKGKLYPYLIMNLLNFKNMDKVKRLLKDFESSKKYLNTDEKGSLFLNWRDGLIMRGELNDDEAHWITKLYFS